MLSYWLDWLDVEIDRQEVQHGTAQHEQVPNSMVIRDPLVDVEHHPD